MLNSELNVHSVLQVRDDNDQWQNIIPAILNNDKRSLTLFGALELNLGISLPSTPEPRGLPVNFDRECDDDGYYVDMKSFLMATSSIFNTWWMGNEAHSYVYLLELCKLKFEATKSDSLYRNLDNTNTTNPAQELDGIVNICKFILSNLIYSHGNFQNANFEKVRIVFGFNESIEDDDSDNENINVQKKSPFLAYEDVDVFVRFIYADEAMKRKKFSQRKREREEIDRNIVAALQKALPERQALSDSIEPIEVAEVKKAHRKLAKKAKEKERGGVPVAVPFFTEKQLAEVKWNMAVEEYKKQCTIC
jgi:hypothetical protein